MSGDILLAAPCGLYCGECGLRGRLCEGCGNVSGKPFWTERFEMEACPIYACAVTKHGLEHCGECEEFPCETFTSLRDPSMSDEEYRKSLWNRQVSLESRAVIGTPAWLESRSD